MRCNAPLGLHHMRPTVPRFLRQLDSGVGSVASRTTISGDYPTNRQLLFVAEPIRQHRIHILRHTCVFSALQSGRWRVGGTASSSVQGPRSSLEFTCYSEQRAPVKRRAEAHVAHRSNQEPGKHLPGLGLSYRASGIGRSSCLDSIRSSSSALSCVGRDKHTRSGTMVATCRSSLYYDGVLDGSK